MEPLATYTERLLQVRRTFTLYSDRVAVKAKWLLGRSYEMRVPLNTLDPAIVRMRIRNRLYKRGVLLFGIGGVLTLLSIDLTRLPSISRWAMAGIAVAVAGAILIALTYKPIPFVRFKSQQGKGGLDIGQAGPDAARFEDFVNRVRAQIRERR